jgi:hypothetical protein
MGSPASKAEPSIGGGDAYEAPRQPQSGNGYRWESGTLVPPPTHAYGADLARPDPPVELTDEDLHRLWPGRVIDPPTDSLFLDEVADPLHWLHGVSNAQQLVMRLRGTGVVPVRVLDYVAVGVDRNRVMRAIVKLASEHAPVALALDRYLAGVINSQARARDIERDAKEQP